ncbi:hypothetical protein AZE42_11034 [Rhizopogon vesiculosus]|uniref:Major facilitator superfamily (MFS) profile domain-containing protein n=1 Tax=Rhizopogon vesiculosus TaxID=180088 RepID=A0A1J8QK39_9AGAM|nr:hypothetical protein AZE42_11034 [Rhizopogon vesiculosus]
MGVESFSAVLKSPRHAGLTLSTKDVGTGVQLISGFASTLDTEEALRIRRKIDMYIMPLMCAVHVIQSIDKTTLGSAAILGILEATHLTVNQYNWLSTVYSLGYLLFEYPQSFALQRFPVGKCINIFIWAITLACHAACKNFAGLVVVRFLLGVSEGSITAGFLIVSSMFYTRREQTLRFGYWFLMNGVGRIISGFISFGVAHIKTAWFEPWQWLMVITGLLTLILAISFCITAGHTKKVVTNAAFLSASCIGNAVGPFMWRAQYKPRENRLRDAEPIGNEEEDHVPVIEGITEDGDRVEVEVDKEFLDMTDRQNRNFRYIL